MKGAKESIKNWISKGTCDGWRKRNEDYYPLYVKLVHEIFENQIVLFGREDFMFHPD